MTDPERSAEDRAQGHTLEAVISAFLLLASIGFALQMTAVTPLSASTSSQHVENQLHASAEGVLASTAESGALSEAVRYWNTTGNRFHDADSEDGYYTGSPPDTTFGNAMNRTFTDRNIAYNVKVVYQNENGTKYSQRMVWQGRPSDHAIKASRTVALTDDDPLIDEDGSRNQTTVRAATDGEFYMPDSANMTSGNRGLYNLVRVEVVAWRI